MSKPLRTQPGATRDRIVAAAVELFAAEGYGGAALRDIAGVATVNVASIYHYFPSKEDLLVHIIDGVMRGSYEPARGLVEHAVGPPQALVALTRHHVSFHCERAREAAIADRELGVLPPRVRTRLVTARDAYEALWDEVLREGAAQGLLRVQDRELTRMALLTMCSQVAAWYRPGGRLSVREVADGYARLALRMAGYAPPAKAGGTEQPADVSAS